MGNTGTRENKANSSTVDGVDKQKEDHFKQIKAHFNSSSSGRSFASLSSHQSTFSVSRPWSRISRRRWKESTLTLPYESSKTAWPVTQLESFFLPEFPVTASQNEKKFNILQEISRGAFGKVYKAKDLETAQIYALKVLSKSKIIKENSVQQVKDEVHIQNVCGHHPFIVNCPAQWQSRRRLYIVSDFVEGGELFDLLRSYITLPIALVQLYVAQIALALDFLHNAGVIYRDLKPENILLDDEGNIQLIDFGLSKWLSYGSTTRTICGTLRYMVFYNSRKMNARSQVFELMVEAQQVNEAVCCMLHTILFHRTLGKFTYNNEGSYSIGTVGYTDVDCQYIDLTYVCCSSPALDKAIREKVNEFSESLQKNQGSGIGQISLEFYQVKRGRWMFQTDCTPWEIWTIYLELIPLSTMGERQILREKVGEALTDQIFHITEIMNRHEYIPKMPAQCDLANVFDTNYADVQPYLHKVNHSISGPPSSGISVGSTMKKFFSDNF